VQTEVSDGLIVLRRQNPEWAGLLHEAAMASVAEVNPWLGWCHPGFSLCDSENWLREQLTEWDEDRAYEFAIFDAGDNRFLGGAGINNVRRIHQMANLGYWVRSGETGRGIASAATRLAARFGLEQAGLQRIEIVIAVENMVSQRVAEKSGALREGVLRNRLLLHGKIHDAAMYSLTPEDLPG
jgi:ribosomal-protein-serine acetyltransferase